jgi:IS605 OrfB family transposase
LRRRSTSWLRDDGKSVFHLHSSLLLCAPKALPKLVEEILSYLFVRKTLIGQLDSIRSERDRCKKGSRRYHHLNQVYKRVSQQKRNKQQDCLHKASHLIAHKLVERTVVVGDLSQRQMVMKEHRERNKRLNRAVFNDWRLYTFVQMLLYKCLLENLATWGEEKISRTITTS